MSNVVSSETALKSLEEASSAGDAGTICTILQLMRKQFSQKRRNHWSTDTVRPLWKQAVQALQRTTLPEVSARACQLLEVLAQNCKACVDGEWEVVFHQDAPREIVKAMEVYPKDLSVQSSALRALLSMSGCLSCRSFYNRETQDLMARANAISALVKAIDLLQTSTMTMQFETNAHKLTRLAVADAVQALHYICLMNKQNAADLVSSGGLRIIKTSIDDDLNELTVQEHGCMLLAEIVTSEGVTDKDILDCTRIVTTVGRLQIQEKFIEVARAAVWSLARIISTVFQSKHPHLTEVVKNQTWPVLFEEGLTVVLRMLESCELKNDPLVKHCLDFIAAAAHHPQMLSSKILDQLGRSSGVIFDVFTCADDIRIKAMAMRTLCSLAINPLIDTSCFCLTLKDLIYPMRSARFSRIASQKDIFCVQVFGMTLISCVHSSQSILDYNQISQYIQDVHAAIDYILKYIVEGGEEFFFDSSDANEAAIQISCCRYACHCCFIHESCSVHEVLAAINSISNFFTLCGNDCINAADEFGYTLLHKLAKSGQKECLNIFIEKSQDRLDFLKCTADGLNAYQLALNSTDPSCSLLLEELTEEAAYKAKVSFPKELGAHKGKTSANQPTRKKRTAQPGRAETHDQCAAERKREIQAKREAEEQYERALAERRQQLEDMEATVKRPSLDKGQRYEDQHNGMRDLTARLKPDEYRQSQTSSRFFGTENESQLRRGSGDMTSGVTGYSGSTNFVTSLSVSSANNTGSSPDPVAPPAGAVDDRIVDVSLSAFHAKDAQLPLSLSPREDKIRLYNKWNSMSAPSAQSNLAFPDGGCQGPALHSAIYSSVSPNREEGHLRTSIEKTVESGGHITGGDGEDVVDDNQLMSWLSSEITGLIGHGTPEETGRMQRVRDFNSEYIPPPPPQNAPVYDSTGDTAVYQTINHSLSPFYSGNPVGISPYFVHTPGAQWPSPCPPTIDPRLVPQSEICNADGRPGVAHSRFWHTEENDIPSKHLWLGNLNTRLPRSVLKSFFEEYGPIEDVVTFPGRMYAFVNFIQAEDAQRAAKELDNRTLPVLTGNRKLVIKFRPNRKALGRVGDLMPGVGSIEECNGIAPSNSVPVFRSPDIGSPPQPGSEQDREEPDGSDPLGVPCRHLWLGNVCVRPSRTVLFSIFSRYGPVESVRVFPGKTFAFVNFYGGEHAHKAKEALDGRVVPPITGSKALVVRFQRDGAGPNQFSKFNEMFNAIPALQTVESAPGAYVTPNVMVSPGRSGLVHHLEYGQHGSDRRRQSLSPEEHPNPRMSTETIPIDHCQADRLQILPSLDESSSGPLWPGYGPDRGADLVSVPGVEPEAVARYSSAFEVQSIGHLTRTLSAATVGKGCPNPYSRSTTWGSLNDMGDDSRFKASYSATLNPSHSFTGYEKGFSAPFIGLSSSRSWVNTDAHFPASTAVGSTNDVYSALPQDLFTTSSIGTDLDTQHRDIPGFICSDLV